MQLIRKDRIYQMIWFWYNHIKVKIFLLSMISFSADFESPMMLSFFVSYISSLLLLSSK